MTAPPQTLGLQVFMRDISYSVTRHHLTRELAMILHRSPYTPAAALPLNFHVHLFKDKRGSRSHQGSGVLTLPNLDVAASFLADYGESFPKFSAIISGRRIRFTPSNKPARSEIVESINHSPYIDPKLMEERERTDELLASGKLTIRTIQFGWECRDSVFSVEWEQKFLMGCTLVLDGERRELRVRIAQPSADTLIIAIRFSHILTISAHQHLWEDPVIFLSLGAPPTFESESHPDSPRQRLSALPLPDHARIAPYTSVAMRLVFESMKDIEQLKELSRLVQLHISETEYHLEYRNRFSAPVLEKLQDGLRRLNWCVAFQVEALVRSLAVDPVELLALLPYIKRMVDKKDKSYTASMLRHFGPKARDFFWDPLDESPKPIEHYFLEVAEEFEVLSRSSPIEPTDGSIFNAYHAIITPTTIYLEGPFLERSNRVIRRYDSVHNESFLRVAFADEDHLQYRFDHDVDRQAFVRARVGHFLHGGLDVARRRFQFLAYSQSALKEHSVWFVKRFRDSTHGYIDAPAIITSLGSFDNLEFDPRLMYCPARYGARISQAFTATDVSVSIPDIEEVIYLPDVKTPGNEYCFTDGVGTMSKELAVEISQELRSKRRRGRHHKNHPRAFQVRFMGSKGMLSVDYILQGRAICLRPSMIKFEAPHSREVEVARAFDRPGLYFLNRPLIMLLEGLGIPYRVFKHFQDNAVRETWQSKESLANAARMLESHGLGTSYRLPSILLHFEKLGISNIEYGGFYKKMLEYAINHVLRVLKNHARIPVPDAWTLVGVADVHKFLKERQIFACVKPVHGKAIFLKGPVLISRSPTIHPGDIQIAYAIGQPPEGSCFAKEPLPNTVVFSVMGSRPLSSCLGGGDLDGDVYNLIPLERYPEFLPLRIHEAARYSPAQRKELNRRSTMADIADFVMEYINSDVVGIIASNWLILADQSPEGIFDANCMKLAHLHSDAVDYPKSGNPVALKQIPKLRFRDKPDWNAPETVNPDSARYYESKQAIGRLFREIDLPAVPNPSRKPRRRRERPGSVDHLPETLSQLEVDSDFDSIQMAVENHVSRYIDVYERSPQEAEHIKFMFHRYVSELMTTCSTCILSRMRASPLSEEEAVVGTIAQKSSQPKKRKDMMSRLRDQTDILVRGIREELAGDDEVTLDQVLERGWLAWQLSITEGKNFGAQSFGWIALGSMFETIREIDELELQERGSRQY